MEESCRKEMLCSLMQASSEVVFFLSHDFTLIDFNPTALKLFPFLDGAKNQSFFTLANSHFSHFQPAFNDLDTGHSVQVVADHSRQSSMYIDWLLVKYDTFYLLRGVDRTNETLAIQRAELLENVIAQVPGHLYWEDKNGTVLGMSDDQAQFIGVDKGCELIGTSLEEIGEKLDWPVEVTQRIRANDIEVMNTGRSAIYAEEVVDRQGEWHYFLSFKSPLKDKDGNSIGIVGISTDATGLHNELLKAQRALEDIQVRDRRTEIYLENIVVNMPYHVWWEDRNGLILGCNDQQARSLGLEKASDFVGKTVFDMADILGWEKGMVEALRENDKEVMRSGIPKTAEEEVVWVDGVRRTYLSRKTPLRDEQGKCIGILGISIDITDRKQIEKQLTLEKEKAEEASGAKSEFLATMSHELRTPMNAILGVTQLLAKKKMDKQTSEYLKIVMESGKNLLALINDVLDFSKLDAGKLEINIDVFSLKELISNVVLSFRHQARDRDLILLSDIDNAIPDWISGDSVRVRQILVNLLSNAIKFTDKGTIEIKIECLELDSKKVLVRLSVKDEGIGIPKSQLDQIFDRFTQVESKYSRKFPGTGLGLAICKQLVDAMHGTISVKSKKNKGSHFYCDIPFPVAMKPAIIDLNENQEQDMQELPKNTFKILLVEDNRLNQLVIENMLQDLHCSVDTVDNGQSALIMLSENRYDLVFMDIGLPDMSGLEITQELRAREAKSEHMPVIALTAHAMEEDRKRCFSVGMDDVVTKPIMQDQLQQVLIHWLVDNQSKLH